MIVDCHTHIDYLGVDITAENHLQDCEKVDAVIVLSACTESSRYANAKVSQYAANHDKMIPFAVFNPVIDKVDLKSVSAVIKEGSFKGAVLYCCQGNFHPAHSRAMRFYQAAQQLELPVYFHNMPPFSPTADMEYAQPILLDEIARNFPDLKIIIGGMGVPFVNQTVCLLNKHDNIYAGLTIRTDRVWETYNTVVAAYEAKVMDKLLFGSGYPFAKAENCIEILLGFNKLFANTNLPTVPREQIRSVIERNTLEILGIADA